MSWADWSLILCTVSLLVILISWGRAEITIDRLARLERKVDRIIEHLGVESAPLVPAEVAALIEQGRKIEAIKLYRKLTGADLAESKDAVERHQRLVAKPVGPISEEV